MKQQELIAESTREGKAMNCYSNAVRCLEETWMALISIFNQEVLATSASIIIQGSYIRIRFFGF